MTYPLLRRGWGGESNHYPIPILIYHPASFAPAMGPPKAVLELQKRLVCNHECLIKCPPLDCKLTILFTTPPRNKPPGTIAIDTEDFFEWLELPPIHDYYCTPRACKLLPPLYRAVMEEAGAGVRPDIVIWIDGPRVYIPPSLIKPKPRGRNDGPKR